MWKMGAFPTKILVPVESRLAGDSCRAYSLFFIPSMVLPLSSIGT